jgi:type VI secretion system secreted protein VgrG
MPKLLNNNSKVASNSKALSDIAKNQQTDAIESVEQLQQFAEQLEKDVANSNRH